MSKIILETIKVDKVSQTKRLLCYWYAFQKIKAEDASKALIDFDEMLSKNKNWNEIYREYFNNQEIDDEQDILRLYDFVVEEEDESLREQLKHMWEKVKGIINKEVNCEKNLYKILSEKAEDHPIFSKIIIAALTVILMGLIEDCIHDGIQRAYDQKDNKSESIYVLDVDKQYTQIIYEDDKIYIKKGISMNDRQ